MEELESQGKCIFCGSTFSGKSITNHLNTHLFQKQGLDTGKQHGQSYHIRVKAGSMFLQLLLDGGTILKTLDRFLRDIWLECCGHLSEFSYQREKVPMSRKVSEVFYKGLKLDYVYDFGTSTKLDIKVLEVFSMAGEKKIILLSRNEPLKIMCDMCGKKPALEMCTIHDWDAFCEDCIPIHEEECEGFTDYASRPVVNSPRMGECGYTGGSIDVERDGVFKME